MTRSKLSDTAHRCKNAGEFIRQIQVTAVLLDELYKFERSTPENRKRFEDVGWFGIAAAFWEESRAIKIAVIMQPPITFPVMVTTRRNVSGRGENRISI